MSEETRITSWKAKTGILEVTVCIEPWSKYATYNRNIVKLPGGYNEAWKWVEGSSENNNNSWHAPDEVAEELDRLVLAHNVLGLLWEHYGIEREL